ncbi:MAG: tripartite tricarboxylate transporter TctB family protein [Thiolinea sp.]
MSDLFQIQIVFEQSHLFFPRIIHWLLLIMFALVVLFQLRPYWQAVRAGEKSLPFAGAPFDAARFFGTLLLTIAYFLLMPWVGEQFPNTGLGFLLVSMPYMFLLSVLFLHHRDGRHLLFSLLNAVLAPLVAWYVLAKLFGITLP